MNNRLRRFAADAIGALFIVWMIVVGAVALYAGGILAVGWAAIGFYVGYHWCDTHPPRRKERTP